MFSLPSEYALLDRWLVRDGSTQYMRIVSDNNITVMGTYADYARLLKKLSMQTVVIYGSDSKHNTKKEGYTVKQAKEIAEDMLHILAGDNGNKKGRKYIPAINIVDPYDGTLHATLGKGE